MGVFHSTLHRFMDTRSIPVYRRISLQKGRALGHLFNPLPRCLLNVHFAADYLQKYIA